MARHVDNFSEWHKCQRWEERGLTCPFRPVEREDGGDEDAEGRPSGAEALRAAIGDEVAMVGSAGFAEMVGPLLALFTVLRGVQTLRGALPLGRVQAAALSEEATVRVLRPRVPAREGPTPAKPTPAKVPVAGGRVPARSFGGAGGGFFVNQAQVLQQMMGRR